MTTILNKPTGPVLSGSLRSIEIETTAEYVRVFIGVPRYLNIYDNILYPVDGKVTLYSPNSIIEAYMRTKEDSPLCNLQLWVIEAEASEIADSCTLQVLYCDRLTNYNDAASLSSSYFLTIRRTRRVPPNFTDRVSALVSAGNTSSIELYYTVRNKNTGALFTGTILKKYEDPQTYSDISFDISSAEILSKAVVQSGVPSANLRVATISVICGQRTISYYIDPSLKAENCFMFRNMFNVLERIYLPGITTTTTKIDQQTGEVDGVITSYDRVIARHYKVNTGALSAREACTIDSLLSSDKIQKVMPLLNGEECGIPVLITDIKCEISDDPDEPSSVEFTWQYADIRPAELFTSSVSAIRTFSPQYNTCFC